VRWKLYPCPECGDAARCRCGLEQCGHHGERAAVEVVPADQLAEAVADRDRYWQALVDIAGHENWEPMTLGDMAREALGPPPTRGQ
jgi:hypothetical protein